MPRTSTARFYYSINSVVEIETKFESWVSLAAATRVSVYNVDVKSPLILQACKEDSLGSTFAIGHVIMTNMFRSHAIETIIIYYMYATMRQATADHKRQVHSMSEEPTKRIFQ